MHRAHVQIAGAGTHEGAVAPRAGVRALAWLRFLHHGPPAPPELLQRPVVRILLDRERAELLQATSEGGRFSAFLIGEVRPCPRAASRVLAGMAIDSGFTRACLRR